MSKDDPPTRGGWFVPVGDLGFDLPGVGAQVFISTRLTPDWRPKIWTICWIITLL